MFVCLSKPLIIIINIIYIVSGFVDGLSGECHVEEWACHCGLFNTRNRDVAIGASCCLVKL